MDVSQPPDAGVSPSNGAFRSFKDHHGSSHMISDRSFRGLDATNGSQTFLQHATSPKAHTHEPPSLATSPDMLPPLVTSKISPIEKQIFEEMLREHQLQENINREKQQENLMITLINQKILDIKSTKKRISSIIAQNSSNTDLAISRSGQHHQNLEK